MVQRFLPQHARSARFAHIRWIVFFCPAFGAAAYVSREIPPVAVICLILCVGSLALRVRGLRRPPIVLEVDLDRRTITVVQLASRGNPESLDSWEPLMVSQVEQPVRESDSTTTAYVVTSSAHPEIALFVASSPEAARRKMEGVARQWKIASRALGGAVRTPSELGVPLHLRLHDDASARATLGPLSQWGVGLQSSSDGHALTPLAGSVSILGQLVLLVIFVAIVGYENAGQFRTELSQGDPEATFLAVLGAAFFLIFLVLGIRATFFPPVLRITPHGVSYGFKKMDFSEIEEVTATSPLQIVGGRKHITLSGAFCTSDGRQSVAHEIQRLIIETATLTA
jgi:hypothetical protein